MLHKNSVSGFTLIEMSIVLVIIGLIVSGIVMGQSMIRQSQVSSVATDEQMYVAAFKNFQQTYGMLPGDFSGATQIWGGMSTCPAVAGTASPGGTLTCNGNGNGQIDNWYEHIFTWQHLSNAGMIPGYYTGIPANTGGTVDTAIGINSPASKIDGGGFGIFYVANGVYTTDLYPGIYNHAIFFGSVPSTGSGVPIRPILTTQEGQALDSKYDDGAPGTGNITIWLPSYENYGCGSTSVASTATYVTSNTGPRCSFVFITGF